MRKSGNRNPKIILFVFDPSFPNRKFVYSTSLTINEKNWDKRRNRPKLIPGSKNEYDIININKRLDLFVDKTKEFLSSRYNEISLDKSDLNNYLTYSLENESSSKNDDKTFFTIWEEIINTTKNPRTGNILTYNTKKSKRQTLNLLKSY
ncbi:MAG: hypothetical protein ACK56I_30220, partial [bacterium]